MTHEKRFFFQKPIFTCYQRIKWIKTYFVVPLYVLYLFGNSVLNWNVSVEQGNTLQRFSKINRYNTCFKLIAN